ncbi:MAG: AEC family transporter [Proteobacteria bacterium]|nr:AEC family transporter [Pseudomonadota bacterium]
MEVIVTIIPIFVIIILGWVARKRGFITPEFLEPANRLVYYLSLPALIFNSIAKTKFHEQFDGLVLCLTLVAAAAIYLTANVSARIIKMNPSRIGAFVQSSGHGNLGYIGLPIALYYLGETGLAKAGIICGFLMILQNLLSVVALQMHDASAQKLPGWKTLASKLLGNPVIIGAMAGIVVSALAIPIPKVILRCLDILGGLAPPTALLLIGASLSLQLIRTYQRPTISAVIFKLVLLPAIGLLLFNLFNLSADDYLPAVILLCSPTATVAYVMAREMHGDADFAVATISASTLLSSITFMLWLAFVASFGR